MSQRAPRPWTHAGGDEAASMIGSRAGEEMVEVQDRRPRYEILRVVNRGGMGEIALALAKGVKGFEKLVVLKRLRADAEREDHIQMFDVEQEVMSRIEHPNIVKVFDQPYIEDIPYMAMEYIRGRNLDQVVRTAFQAGEELPLNLTLTVMSEVLRGLAFVHRLKDSDGRALGVVHQDMTPSNVLVSFFGEVKITDFGISYVTSRDGGLRKGVLKGKPRYVAPEVLAGKRVNNRADIYGVGVVMYELLTGRALFARPTVKETLSAVARNELPDFENELGRMGTGVAQILERSLRKDPSDRYRTAEAMAADVLNELSKRGGPMPPATLGYLVRQLFRTDPDVPEIDPDFEQAITRGSSNERGESASPAPRNLDETLQELDRLLGPSKSVDLFTLPPELEIELGDLKDMDPFTAETPLPEFIWEARTDQEILERAQQHFPQDSSSLVGEPPPLFPDGEAIKRKTPESRGAYAQVPASRDRPLSPGAGSPFPPPRRPPEIARTPSAEQLGAGSLAREPELRASPLGSPSLDRISDETQQEPWGNGDPSGSNGAPPAEQWGRAASETRPPDAAHQGSLADPPGVSESRPLDSALQAPRISEAVPLPPPESLLSLKPEGGQRGAAERVPLGPEVGRTPAEASRPQEDPSARSAFWRGLVLGLAVGAAATTGAFMWLGF